MGNRINRKLLQFWVLEREYKQVKAIIEKQQEIARSIPGQHQFTIGDTLEFIVKDWAKYHGIKTEEE